MNDNPDKNLSLNCGKIDIELHQGDIFDLKVDAIICPVDQTLTTEDGLFGVIKKRMTLPENPLGDKKKMLLGESILASVTDEDSTVRQIILASVISPYETVERGQVQQALSRSLEIAEEAGFETVATKLLGTAESKSTYGVMCWTLIKSAKEFSKSKAKNLKKVILSVYNEKAFQDCHEQFFTFGQNLNI